LEKTLEKTSEDIEHIEKHVEKPLKHVGKKMAKRWNTFLQEKINTWWIFSISMLDFRKVNFWVNGRF